MLILDASLDTSFWNRASEVGVAPYLFQFFRVYYCATVKREIISTDPDETTLIYPQAMLFQVFDEDKRLHQAEPERLLRRFGAGEAHAIALALERKWVLLINDNNPLLFARTLGITCISVPAFCLLLYQRQKITYAACQGYFRRLAYTTSASLIAEAEAIVHKLAIARGESL
jgi:predicted nucleic acid-binding protein